jgi:hypothetical protein
MTSVDHALKLLTRTILLLAVEMALAPIPVAAQPPTAAPGGWIYLDTPVRRGVECWIGFSTSDCSGARWKSPGLPTEASGSLIRGTFAPILPVGVGVDNRAIAWLDYEFAIEGTHGFVNTSIAVKYDSDVLVSGGAAYAVNNLLTLTLTDISDPNEAYISSLDLLNGNRQGDQGLTDVSGGGEEHISSGDVGSLNVTLARGRRYRARVAAQGSGSMLILGSAAAMTQAQIQYLRVQVDPDVFTRLEQHDTEMKALIATHDTEIKALIATHDADIKALIKKLQDGQTEIIRLLLTPEGRRSTTFCPSGDCSFPSK